jgi:hypothetical protein
MNEESNSHFLSNDLYLKQKILLFLLYLFIIKNPFQFMNVRNPNAEQNAYIDICTKAIINTLFLRFSST